MREVKEEKVETFLSHVNRILLPLLLTSGPATLHGSIGGMRRSSRGTELSLRDTANTRMEG